MVRALSLNMFSYVNNELFFAGHEKLLSLHVAAVHSQSSVIELLLRRDSCSNGAHSSRGHDVDCLDSRKRTPLMIACQMGDCDSVKTLVNQGARVGLTDKTGDGVLHKVARCAQGKTFESYLSKPFVTSNERSSFDKSRDYRKGQMSVLKFLLRKTISNRLRINWRNRKGDTALSILCSYCDEDQEHYRDMIALLTSAGADPFIINSSGSYL